MTLFRIDVSQLVETGIADGGKLPLINEVQKPVI